MDSVLVAIGESLPIAVGLLLAAAPMAIIALLLVIKRPLGVVGAFLAGWVLGLTVVGGLVILLADLVMLGEEPAWWAAYLKIALGIVLLMLAIRKWRARPGDDDEPSIPKWMAGVDTVTAHQALAMAFLLASLNPKHVVLVIAGATVIADAASQILEQIVALAVFVVVASLGVAAPAIMSVALGERSGPVLARLEQWMIANNAVIMSVVLLVIGAILIGDGIASL